MSLEELGTVVLVTGLLRWERLEGLVTQVLPPVLSCPPLSSLGLVSQCVKQEAKVSWFLGLSGPDML